MNRRTRKLLKKRQRYARLLGRQIHPETIRSIVEDAFQKILSDLNRPSRLGPILTKGTPRCDASSFDATTGILTTTVEIPVAPLLAAGWTIEPTGSGLP